MQKKQGQGKKAKRVNPRGGLEKNQAIFEILFINNPVARVDARDQQLDNRQRREQKAESRKYDATEEPNSRKEKEKKSMTCHAKLKVVSALLI